MNKYFRKSIIEFATLIYILQFCRKISQILGPSKNFWFIQIKRTFSIGFTVVQKFLFEKITNKQRDKNT